MNMLGELSLRPPSAAELKDLGRRRRSHVSRTALAELVPSDRSALEILIKQNAGRIDALVPLRFARMLTDPFSFFRGSAAVMAADLAGGPTPGIEVVSCGDAHVSNFGLYASPHRSLVFDLNDFDEAAFAPAEWDLKRLLTSVVVGGRQAGYPEGAVRRWVRRSAETYRRSLSAVLSLSPLDRYYLRAEPDRMGGRLPKELRQVVRRTSRRARERTSARVFDKIMAADGDGVLRLVEAPPVLQHIDAIGEAEVRSGLEEFLASVPVDVAGLLTQYRLSDIALRVVGVGSVGTRCYLAVLVGPTGSPLILQLKQASRSVLEEYGHRVQPGVLSRIVSRGGEGARVVAGQRVMQATSDVFLGTVRRDGSDYYVRQFQDMKGSVDLARMSVAEFGEYAGGCAALLARAHAQSPEGAIFASYLGRNDTAIRAMTAWSLRYAEKSLADFHQLREAAAAGEITVAEDPLR